MSARNPNKKSTESKAMSIEKVSKVDSVDGKDKIDGSVEEQKWYHGMRPRRDIERLLLVDGDFLVRATDGRTNNVEIVLSIKSEKKGIMHLTLSCIEGKWQLGMIAKGKKVLRFNSIPLLIEHYKRHKLSNSLSLKRGILRPDWLIKHEKVKYDEAKDHLGSGNFCNVYKGKYDKGEDQVVDVAVKICHSNVQNKNDSKSSDEIRAAREMMLAEAKAMSHFVNAYVIQLYGVACDYPPVLIVMEYCPGGSLDRHLLAQKDDIEVGERICYVAEGIQGMRYLHTHHCIHRDLAARNCLISAQGFLKISDFGLSKLLDVKHAEEEAVDEESPQIPLRWMAPESLKRPRKYSKASDVWSFGVLMYEIFNNGEKPWPDWPAKKIATTIRKGNMLPMPEKTPVELKELVASMWQLNYSDRPTFRDIARKMAKVVKKYPSPKATKFSLNKLNGVARLTGGELSIYDEDHTDNANKDSQDTTANKSTTEDDKNPQSTTSVRQP